VYDYPPPAQVAGVLLNAIFLDLLDTDAIRLEQMNALIDRLPIASRNGLRHIEMLVLRPSRDLGRLANEFEIDLPRAFRFLVRGLGSRRTRSSDMLSLLMFQREYIARLIELGEADARARSTDIDAFISKPL
jgi:NTE family protein